MKISLMTRTSLATIGGLLILSSLSVQFGLSPVWAQTAPSQTKGSGAKPGVSRIPSATALGDIFFKSRDSLIFSLGVQESATNNLYFSPLAVLGVPYESDRYIPFTTLSARIAYQRQLQRASIALDYGLGGLLLREADSGDFLTQDGGIDLSYQITPRATLTLGDRLSVGPAPGRFYRRDLVLAAVTQQVLPNETVFIGLTRTITNAGFATFSYEPSRRSQMTFGANGTITRFQQRDFSEMNQSGATLTYSYKAAERTTISLGYNLTYYDFSGSRTSNSQAAFAGIARSHLAYFGVQHQLTPSIGAFVQAGPNYVVGNAMSFLGGTAGRPGVRASVNGGLTFGQAISLDPRTFFSINAGQSISDGYGLGGMTQTQAAGFSLGRRMTKTLTGAVQTQYSRNKFLLNLDTQGRPVTTNGASAGVNLSWSFAERANVFLSHTYLRQLSSGFSTLLPDHASGHTFVVGLNYHFPLFF